MGVYDENPAVILNRRLGTSDSPFVPITESLVINNDGKVILTEIPDFYKKVIVTSGDSTIWSETDGFPTGNQYQVDYDNKIVTFDIANKGKQLNFQYTGTGNHYFSPSSIYSEQNNGDVTQTLQDLITALQGVVPSGTTVVTHSTTNGNVNVNGTDIQVYNDGTLKTQMGTLSNLTTTANSDLVSAVNEVKSATNTNKTNIGTLSSLTTTAKSDVVSAVNEVKSASGTNATNIGTLSTLLTTDKTSLVNALNEVKSTNNSDNGINVKLYGAAGDGTTDDSKAFNSAHAQALSTGAYVFIPEGTYYISATTLSNINVASMIGKGIGKSILKVSGNVNFTISQNAFVCQGLTIQVDYMIASTQSTGNALLVNYTSTLNSLILKDIQYQNISGISDGTQRSVSLFRCHASNALFENLYLDGTHTGIVVKKIAGTDCKNIHFKDIYFTNTQTGIYVSGGDPNVTGTDVIKNVKFDNINLVNTAPQALQYSQINGSDVIMLEKCNNVKIDKLYGEFACERLAYLNVCQNVVLGTAYAYNTEGIKYVGYVSKGGSIYNYAEGFTADSVTLHTDNNQRQVRAFITYDSKNVTVNKINAFDDNTTFGNSGIDSVIELNRSVTNLTLSNIVASNVLRGVLFLNMVYSSDYDCLVNGLNIHNVDGTNVVTGNSAYTAIRMYLDPAITSGYTFQNVLIEGMNIQQNVTSSGSFTTMYSSTSPLSGLYNLDRVSFFRAQNNKVYGISSNEPFTIGQNSYNVVLNEKLWSLSMMFKGSYLSQGSVLDFIQTSDSSRTATVRNRVQTNSSTGDSMAVGLTDSHQQGTFEWYGSLTNGQTATLPWNSNCLIGDGYVYDSGGNYMHFLISGSPASLTKVDGTTATAISNTANDLCVYLSSNTLTLINNLGSTRRIGLRFNYSC